MRTNPAGVCFISYTRKRSNEVARIISLLHEHGVPTWRDVTDLGSVQTEEQISAILNSPETASAILFVTPEVAASDYVRSLEAPLIFKRGARKDGFSLIVVASGGLKREEIGAALGPGTGPIDPATWNIYECSHDPITDGEARVLAQWVLDQRLVAIDNEYAPDAPLKIEVITRGPAEKHRERALVANFSHCFDGRLARGSSWDDCILPGLRSIKEALRKHNRGRKIECSGTLCLAAAVILGIELMPQTRLEAAWMQEQGPFGLKPELWWFGAAGDSGDIRSDEHSCDIKRSDLALLVAVPPYDIEKVTHDVRATFGDKIPFRGLVRIWRAGEGATSGGTAARIAVLAAELYKKAESKWMAEGGLHLFLAVPAGLAFMIGQHLNAISKVQAYEFLAGQPQPYVKAATIQASNT